MTKENYQFIAYYTLLAFTLLLSLYIFSSYLGVIAFSIVFAIVFYPLHKRISNIIKVNSALAAFLSTMVVIAVIFIPISFFIFKIFQEANQFYATTFAAGGGTRFFNNLNATIRYYFPHTKPIFAQNFNIYLSNFLNWIVNNMSIVFSGIAKIALNITLAVLAIFYFFKDGKKFQDIIFKFSPLPIKYSQELFGKIVSAINSVVRGSIVVALVQGALTISGFWVFNIPNPVLWGSFAFVASFIPGVGTALVIVPGILFLLFSKHLLAAVGLSLWGFFAVGLIDNLLGSFIIGKGTSVHPLIILFAVIGGLTMFGFIGFLLGPIIVAILFALFETHPVLVEEIKSSK